jgi:hypothetical protein
MIDQSADDVFFTIYISDEYYTRQSRQGNARRLAAEMHIEHETGHKGAVRPAGNLWLKGRMEPL